MANVGRVAVVTGSNKGIGYFIALQLGECGLFQNVVLACRDSSRAAEAVANIQSQLPDTVKVVAEQLTLGNEDSHAAFGKRMAMNFGKIDCLVNNAAMAFKQADPTPFKDQTKPTLAVNFWGTLALTETLLPLLNKGSDPRIVNVCSMAGRLAQVSPALQSRFSSDSLTMDELKDMVLEFERCTQDGTHREKGYSGSNYGMSKLAMIAATKILARENASISVNCCCPGYCKTDMTSQRGMRHPSDGAKNAVIPATVENPPSGAFYSDFQIAAW